MGGPSKQDDPMNIPIKRPKLELLPPLGSSPVPQAQLEDNAIKYERCKMDPKELGELKQVCDQIEKIERESQLYSKLEARTGVERWAIAGIHYRECSLSMLGCLHNGDRVIGPEAVKRKLKTTNEPVGLGPWLTFEDSAVDSILRELKMKGWKAAPVGIADTLGFTERYNGLGPRNHNIDSGYNWGGTDEEDLGGYPSDGKWDKNREETRIGVVAIMKEMLRRELEQPAEPAKVIDFPGVPAAQVYEKLVALGASVGLDARPIQQLIDYHKANLSAKKLRFWAIVDFTQSSKQKRFYLLDTVDMRVERHLVAHGAGSDPDNSGMATKFSNTDGSHMSCLGIVRCAELYSSHGERRMRLDGLQASNSNVRARAIVMHSASYVNEAKGQCGRSWGCTVLDSLYLEKAVQSLTGGSLMNLWKA